MSQYEVKERHFNTKKIIFRKIKPFRALAFNLFFVTKTSKCILTFSISFDYKIQKTPELKKLYPIFQKTISTNY